MAQAAQYTDTPAQSALPFWALHAGVEFHIKPAEAAAHNAAVQAESAEVATPNPTGLAPHLACFAAIQKGG